MTHLKLADLIVFSGEPVEGDERKKIEGHLNACALCRSRLISFNTYRAALAGIPENLAPFELTDSCIPTQLMGDFLGGRLPESEYRQYSNHVDDCDYCFERAAFFTHSSVKMAKGALYTQSTPEKFIRAVVPEKIKIQAPAKRSLAEKIRRFFTSPAPAYGLAVCLIFFMVFWNRGGPRGIIDLDSGKSFVIYEKPMQSGPSFGFSDAGRKIGEVDAGLNVVKTTDGRALFTWKPVEGADEYHFSLSQIQPDGSGEVYDLDTTAPLVTLDISTMKTGKAYRWSVRGETSADKVFSATGLFVITQ
ncbi:hypothetical protein MNBD_NITROSPINAE03-1959 [hydrothermal vent metagenome]|uniref:Zinc-finger domain-containing protein n=1 Tax=hydrothermal vent metagenome TaxID=652676 RepID=A0A3B1BPZ1_9ZZZZ